jgi:hypothetical protein
MRAADQSVGMRLARWSAALIILGVGAAAFQLSFTTLKHLAKLAGMPAEDAWLFPLVVDGTILLATFGVLACGNHKQERRFFLGVLVVSSLVSIAGNAVHAVVASDSPLGWAAALVAAVAPVSLLVDTHGLALLFRVVTDEPTSAESERVAESEPASAASPAESAPEPVTDPVPEPESEPVAPAVPVLPSVPAPALAPAPVAPIPPVRSSRPVQTMLPLAVPVGGA